MTSSVGLSFVSRENGNGNTVSLQRAVVRNKGMTVDGNSEDLL